MKNPLRTTVTAAVMIVAATLLATACGEDGEATGPVPGTLEVALATPHADDAAMVIEIVGPDIGAVTAAETGHYLHTVESGTTVTAVLVGSLGSGRLVRFSVPDVDALDAYSAIVIQAADESNALKTLSGYHLTVSEVGGL